MGLINTPCGGRGGVGEGGNGERGREENEERVGGKEKVNRKN